MIPRNTPPGDNAYHSSHGKGSSRWSHATATLWFATLAFSFGNILFGIDTGSFGSLQALPAWLAQFGEPGSNGTYHITTERKSILNSMPWIGKAVGTFAWSPLVDRFGYKAGMLTVAIVQIVALIIELTSKEYIQFTAGRSVAYVAAGLVENLVPNYCSEIAPVPLRAFFSGSLMVFNLFGHLWGAGMSRAYKTVDTKAGWMVPVGVQIAPAVCLLLTVPWTPESPRWFIVQGKREKAAKSLMRLRDKTFGDDSDGTRLQLELNAIEAAVAEGEGYNNGRWIDLFRGTYFRRASVAAWLFIWQQWTALQFVNSYGPTFYKQQGLGAHAFTYQMIPFGISIVVCLFALFLYDKVGRRPVLIVGTALQLLFMLLSAGLGTKKNPTSSQKGGFVASLILAYVTCRFSISTCAFITASEIGGTHMRRKVMAWATFWDVVAAFVSTFSTPYVLAKLGAKIGWVFSGTCFLAFVFSVFFVPELKGRSLEETDELFEARLWAWQFHKVRTHGAGARIAALEGARQSRESDEETATDISTVVGSSSGSEEEVKKK